MPLSPFAIVPDTAVDPRETRAEPFTGPQSCTGCSAQTCRTKAASPVAVANAGMVIVTLRGEVPVEALRVGDRVLTRDNGFQPIRWVGSRRLTRAELNSNPEFNPIEIEAGALGGGLPKRRMRISPQHRMLIESHDAGPVFGTKEVLVAAAQLTCLPGVRRVEPESVVYIHVLFDRHEIILADGAWTESFQPSDGSLAELDQDARDEVYAIFPELAELGQAAQRFRPARVSPPAPAVMRLLA